MTFETIVYKASLSVNEEAGYIGIKKVAAHKTKAGFTLDGESNRRLLARDLNVIVKASFYRDSLAFEAFSETEAGAREMVKALLDEARARVEKSLHSIERVHSHLQTEVDFSQIKVSEALRKPAVNFQITHCI